MRTLVLSALLVALWPRSVQAQAAPAPTPLRVVAPPAPVVAPAPAVTPAVPVAPVAAPLPPPAQPAAVMMPPPVSGAPAAPAATPLPPPPQGYEYGYGESAGYPLYHEARRNQMRGELKVIDARLRELQGARREVGLGAPISMMAVGFGAALISGMVALTSFAVAEGIDDDDPWDDRDGDWNNDGDVNSSDERAARNTGRVFSIFTAVGIGVGIGGSFMLANRLEQRRVNGPEIHELKERRRDLRRELRYGASVAPSMAQLSVSGRF